MAAASLGSIPPEAKKINTPELQDPILWIFQLFSFMNNYMEKNHVHPSEIILYMYNSA